MFDVLTKDLDDKMRYLRHSHLVLSLHCFIQRKLVHKLLIIQ